MYGSIGTSQRAPVNRDSYNDGINLAITELEMKCAHSWNAILNHIVAQSIISKPHRDDSDSLIAREAAEKAAYVKLYRRLAMIDNN